MQIGAFTLWYLMKAVFDTAIFVKLELTSKVKAPVCVQLQKEPSTHEIYLGWTSFSGVLEMLLECPKQNMEELGCNTIPFKKSS